jgi:UDPglucose--hexose-1-phosphate uridylyltransferase
MTLDSAPLEFPHRRRNVLNGDWVLVSPHRTKRPWQGKQEDTAPDNRPQYDPTCYLCPGNSRAAGVKNPPYESTFIFTNDFAAVLPEAGAIPGSQDDPLFQALPVAGECRVICFSARHDLTLPEMPLGQIERVINLWAEQFAELSKKWKWVQVFENKGAVMGCSNPHPHGQIWASDQLPHEATKEDAQQADYWARHGRSLLLDYAQREAKANQRIVVENEHWLALVPYWAVWPYEILLLPRRQVRQLPELTSAERSSLADVMKRLLTRYDNLFKTSFPYSMGWHGAPGEPNPSNEHWHLHAHFYPPLLRSATVKKFMVGYEMLGEAQRDLTPEQAAGNLRAVSDEVHFKSLL